MVRSGKANSTKRNEHQKKSTRPLTLWLVFLGALFCLVALVSFNLIGVGAVGAIKVADAVNPQKDIEVQVAPVTRLELVRTVQVVASAYSSHVYQTDATPCITANGYDLCESYLEDQSIDTVAANGLPFGTVVKFPQLFPHLTFTVRDRMNARYGARFVDIWLPTSSDATTFGRRILDMEVYKQTNE